jgi:hypothetical protein
VAVVLLAAIAPRFHQRGNGSTPLEHFQEASFSSNIDAQRKSKLQ